MLENHRRFDEFASLEQTRGAKAKALLSHSIRSAEAQTQLSNPLTGLERTALEKSSADSMYLLRLSKHAARKRKLCFRTP